jgi:hypothetical protein
VDRAPASDRLRIALFGASYTAGAWWRSLEKSLNDSGVPAEVLNFGCGGYGVDQAFLRWRKKGSAYKANIVIFGFSRKNCESDLNIFRLFAEPDSGIPFMKPRFLLAHDQLQLINTPTPAPGELPGIVARFGDWPLAGCEHFFVPADFQAFPWRHSALLALFEANLANTRGSNTGSIPAGGEEAQLALKIVRQFKSEVEAAGGSFYIVHLPLEADLQAFQDTGAFPFAGLLAEVKRTAIVFQPESAMLAVAQGHDLSRFFSDGHYTSEFNLAAGQSVAKALLACPEVVRFRKDHGGTSR